MIELKTTNDARDMAIKAIETEKRLESNVSWFTRVVLIGGLPYHLSGFTDEPAEVNALDVALHSSFTDAQIGYLYFLALASWAK